MKKGIFWCDSFGRDSPHLIVVSVHCDADGESDQPIDYSSKSGQNFNHKAEWQKLSRSVTGGQPFNYYPRGRVEIKYGNAIIYLNPDLNNATFLNKIMEDFELKEQKDLKSISVKKRRFKSLSIPQSGLRKQ